VTASVAPGSAGPSFGTASPAGRRRVAGRLRDGWSRRSRQERLAYRLLLPVFLTVFVIATIPLLLAIAQALRNDSGAFVGLDNFSRALGNTLLYESAKQTGIYAAIVLPSEILLGLGLALLVHRTIRSAGLRALIYVLAMIPIFIPQIAVGVVFRLVFAPDYGILNVLLGDTGRNQLLWLSSPPLAMLSVAIVDIWQWTPFVYLVMFAGFQTVPSEAVEAAQVDGATSWTQFRHIELHYLRPLLLLVLFFRIADVLRVFDAVYVLTGGGPGATTQFLSLYLYRIAFRFSDLGQASALAVVLMISMTIFYTIITRFLPVEAR
jgi:multiple sugar transport system permease protein